MRRRASSTSTSVGTGHSISPTVYPVGAMRCRSPFTTRLGSLELGALVDPRIVRRSSFLLAATLACLSGMVQLVVAVATITLVLVTGVEGILGLGPAVFLVAGACVALPAGRAMDRHGRVPVLAAGCVVGIVGCLVSALGAGVDATVLVLSGFILVGFSSGTVLLARAAAADLYPPERRARGISLVLFGALFGAVLGPTVFRPLLAGKELAADALVLPYLAAAAIMAVALACTLAIRPDPEADRPSAGRSRRGSTPRGIAR